MAGRAEAGAGPSWAAVETQTGGTSRHKSRPGDFWAGKLWLWGGWTAGRVGMLKAKEECRPHPRPETPAGLPEVGTTRWLVSSFRTRAIPGVPRWVQGAGHPWSRGCCCGLSASFFSSTVKPGFQFLPTRLVGWARPDEWEPGEGSARRPAGARSHRQASVYIFLRRLRPALGVSAGKARGRGGDPKLFSPGQDTPWHPPAGRVGHTVSESRSFTLLLQDSSPGPHVWVWEGVGGWQISHFGPPSLLSPDSCSWGPLPWRIEKSQFPGSHPEVTS